MKQEAQNIEVAEVTAVFEEQAREASQAKSELAASKVKLETSIATKEAEISKAIEEAKNAGDGGNPEQLAELKKEVETIEVAEVAAVFEEQALEASKERAVTKVKLETSIAAKEAEISKAIEEAKNAGDGANPEELAKLEKQLADLKQEVQNI